MWRLERKAKLFTSDGRVSARSQSHHLPSPDAVVLVAIFKVVNQEPLILSSQHVHGMPVGLFVAGEFGGEILLDVFHVITRKNIAKLLRFLLPLDELVAVVIATDLNKVTALDGRRLQTAINDRRKDLQSHPIELLKTSLNIAQKKRTQETGNCLNHKKSTTSSTNLAMKLSLKY